MRIIRDTDYLTSACRRVSWFLENLTLKKLVNLCLAGSEFTLKRERMIAWPLVLKIDISPLCNLRCTVCVHAKPNGEGYLENQYFHKSHKMPVKSYRRIIDEIKGRSTAVSLYYMGDPLLHPDLDEMCHIAHKAGLNVHISTNFSFRLSDERIRSLVESGVTHITVAVDGLSQETYGLTRINGNIEWVLSNLKRLCQFKQERGQLYPKIEVQYLKFKHNLNELEPALRLFKEFKVDQMTIKTGEMENWASLGLRKEKVVGGERNKLLPKCTWPHFFMLVKYNGDVIPCCTYREREQYSVIDDSRSVGNVFQTSVWEIWNSPKYRQMRRLVSNPSTGALEAESEKIFCYGCRKVYTVSER
jgi:MoaA/NifB/PqqE/SkfB family radical SAM enzyme